MKNTIEPFKNIDFITDLSSFEKDIDGYALITEDGKYNFRDVKMIKTYNNVEAYFENCKDVYSFGSSTQNNKNCEDVEARDNSTQNNKNCKEMESFGSSTQNNES